MGCPKGCDYSFDYVCCLSKFPARGLHKQNLQPHPPPVVTADNTNTHRIMVKPYISAITELVIEKPNDCKKR